MKKIYLLAIVLLTIAACSSPSTDITGEWKLISYGDTGNPTPALPNVDTSFKFENGQLNGNAGCNTFGGSYGLKDNTLTFGAIMSTLMFCDTTSTQEQGVLSIFSNNANLQIKINNATLTLTSADGRSVVNLARK